MSQVLNSFFLLGIIHGISIPLSGQTPAVSPPDTVRECTDQRLQSAATSAGGRRCFESNAGWFLTSDRAWANTMSAAIERAGARFAALFGEPIGRGALFHRTARGKADTTVTDNGQTVIRVVTEPEPWDTAVFKAAGAQWTSTEWTSSQGDGLQSGVLLSTGSNEGAGPHELGHQWFASWFEKRATPARLAAAANVTARYGSLATDWLDEAAALQMEDSAQTKNRYNNLRRLARGSLLPLDTLFTMGHPSNVSSLGAVLPQNTQALLNMFQGMMEGRGMHFYEQCRGFMDFLIERAGNPAIFGAIAVHDAAGGTMAEWLQANGTRYGLPTTVSALDQEWQSWVAKLPAVEP